MLKESSVRYQGDCTYLLRKALRASHRTPTANDNSHNQAAQSEYDHVFEYWSLSASYRLGRTWKRDPAPNNGSRGKLSRGVSWLKGSDGICNIVRRRISKFYGYRLDWFGGTVDCGDCAVECCDGA